MRPLPVIVRDPVHGDIELTREELRLIDTTEFQRLRGIKQLGTANLVFPGAVHTRFEHSIGTLHMADRLLTAADKHAQRDPATARPVGDDERRVVRFAALLHDVTHIPYGHNIEDQTGLIARHDGPERYRAVLGDTQVGAVLDALGVRDEVLAILAPDLPSPVAVPPFWRQVLSHTIDADLLDYLRRDSYYTGLELRYDQRVCDYFRIDPATERMFVDCEKQGMLREDIMSELMRVLEIRYHFSERVYYHHAKVAAGALIARMVELALGASALSLEQLQTSTDQSLIDDLSRADLGDETATARLRRFVSAFQSRRLPKRVLVLPVYLNRDLQDQLLQTYFCPGSPESRFAWEAELERQVREDLGEDPDVLLYCPARAMQLKEAKTLVRLPSRGDEIVDLSQFAAEVPRLAELQSAYPRLWKLYVFSSARDRQLRRRMADLCLRALPAGCVNALRL